MNPSWLDKLLSKKGLYTAFWTVAIFMVVALIVFTANLAKEVPPLPAKVVDHQGNLLYTYDDIVEGKGYFQQFDLMDYGTMLGMGAYLGPDFSTEFLHRRAVFLADGLAREKYNRPYDDLPEPEAALIRALVREDVKGTPTLNEDTVAYSANSTAAGATTGPPSR